jgi:hypothetical protein
MQKFYENHKIYYGRRYFESIGVDYGVMTKLAEAGI